MSHLLLPCSALCCCSLFYSDILGSLSLNWSALKFGLDLYPLDPFLYWITLHPPDFDLTFPPPFSLAHSSFA